MNNGCDMVKALLVTLLHFMITEPTSGVKILLVPASVHSHVLFFERLGTELARLGHDTHLLVPSNVKVPTHETKTDLIRNSNATSRGRYAVTVYPVDDSEPYIGSPAGCKNLIRTAMTKSSLEHFQLSAEFGFELFAHLERDCVRLLENEAVMSAVRSDAYQFAIMDPLAIHCYYALPYSIDLPYSTLSIPTPTLAYRVPRLPSIYCFYDIDLKSFKGRFLSFLFELTGLLMTNTLPTTFIEKYAPGKPILRYEGLIRNSTLWFLLEDIVVGRPLPLMPNTVSVGDLMAGRDGKPLPEQIEDFLTRAAGPRSASTVSDVDNSQGVIVVSFGSFFDHVPDEVVYKFCEAFGRLREGLAVVWKFKNTTACGPINGDRVQMLSWIPQNDLLADPRVRLFVTHAGLNSLIESVYHAKPVITFPIGIDQPANAEAAAANGFGIRLSLGDLDVDSLLWAIDSILTDPKYRQNAERASAIIRDRRETAAERVSNAIEHVIKYGDRHLRTEAFELSLFEFLMLDVFAVIFTIVTSAIISGVLVCRCIVRRCCLRSTVSYKRKAE